MTWGDGSVYKGTWDNGVQNGLGIMKFANGLKKAGTFKDNVLMDMLTSKRQIDEHEQVYGPLPQQTRLEMEEMILDHNPAEDQSPYLRRELK